MKHYLLRYLRKKVEDATVFILLSAWFVAITILMGASVFLGNISYLWVAFGVVFAPLMAIGIFLLAAWVYGGVEHQIQQYRFWKQDQQNKDASFSDNKTKEAK